MMKKYSENKQLLINSIATLFAMVFNYGVNFVLTPYLVGTVGSEAFGFVSLTTNMVNYASIVTVALSSVSGRFISISIHRNEKKDANEYFNSVLWSNVILALGVIIIFAPIIINVTKFLNVPQHLVPQVQALFCFVVLNFVITIISNVFTVATFVTNTLYLSSLANCMGGMLRILLLVIFFSVFPSSIVFVGITSCICSAFYAGYNAYLTKKLNTGLEISVKQFSFKKTQILIGAGIWSSISKLAHVLSDGLDLLICNIALSANAMGQLSIAYTIPTIMAQVVGNVAGIFCPQQTYYYAKGDIDGVVKQIKLNTKMTGFFVSIIFAGFFAVGKNFFELWTPTEDSDLLYALAMISIISVLVTGATTSLNNVFLLTNNLKTNSIVMSLTSLCSVAIVFILISTTNLGVFAIAGVSKIINLIINLTYIPMFACACLKISKKTFYPIIGRYTLCTIVLCFIFKICLTILPAVDSWLNLVFVAFICGIIGCIFNFILWLDKNDREFFVNVIKSKIRKK